MVADVSSCCNCSPQNPVHLCCDNCSVMCECGTYECKPLAYPLCRADLHLNSKRKRSATEEQKTTLLNKLAAYHKKLHTNLLQRDASGKMILDFLICKFNKSRNTVMNCFLCRTFVLWWRYGICSMHLKFMQSCKKYLEAC